jgi:glycosyltransferase involved in cell wall biosynthesis
MAIQAEKLARLLRQDGHHVVSIPSNLPFPKALRSVERLRGVRPFVRSAVFTWKLLRCAPAADVIHVLAASWLYFFLVVAPAVVIARVARRRVIVNYRSGAAREFFRSYGFFAALVFRLASEITAPSRFLAEAIHARFGLRVRIVPNMVDLAAFPYRERSQFAPRFLAVRHLEKMYGVDCVLRAFAAIQQQFPKASLEVAGAGSEDASLRKFVSEAGLRNVCFRGQVAHSDVPALHARADILLNGSHVDNFPGSLVEASASGLAVVSTNVGGIPAIYEHGKTALLVADGDWQAMAEAAIAVLQDSSLGVGLTSAGAEMVREYDWAQVRLLLYESYGFSGNVGARPMFGSFNGNRVTNKESF